MMDEIPDGCFMMVEFLRERKRLPDEPGNTLAKGVVETLDVAGFTRIFADGLIAFGWQDAGISVPEIRMDKGALPVNW